MASLSLRNVYKVYDGNVVAVSDFNLEIEDKEFIIFVGPSGCGKSTTLRMIAGLEEISKGELYIGDVLSNDISPKDRDIAMVFQNYALYPHMTVFDNMAFGLKLRKTPKEEMRRRVEEAARILDISHLLERKPKALSGGQRQRVALGRTQMRTEISKLHKRLGTTFIYVTHDQTEAMTMGDRIVVMKDGFIQQVDTPQNLYEKPCNLFVAGFMGAPQMNFINATIVRAGEDYGISFGKYTITLPESKNKNNILSKFVGRDVILGIRPEDVHDDPEFLEKATDIIEAQVEVTELMGAEIYVYMTIEGESAIARVDPSSTAEAGEPIEIAFDVEKIHIFDKETERTITN